MKEKRCFKCGKVKPLDEFYAHPQMGDGHLNKCKECARADAKEHREAHPERDLETRVRACAKNPSHKNAAMAVDAALRSGRLKRPERCQGCGRSGSETRLSAHHYDYTRPLDVIWLCAACHRPLDRVRAYVESGRPWGEYGRERTFAYNHVRRALKFYATHANLRKPFDVSEIMSRIGW